MMNSRLYFLDPYIKTFEAVVEETGHDEAGYYVILDQTAFYPEGGGQPADKGTLNGLAVKDVQEVAGAIRHYLKEGEFARGNDVKGEIDWERRFDHMQQHTAQHILTAVFQDCTNIETLAFHLGKEVSTIDLSTESLSDETVEGIEQAANKVVTDNIKIDAKWVEEEELNQYPLRKAPAVSEDIRLVIIDGVDYNPCGGTHPCQTGEVGPIQILGVERHKKQLRLSFLAGGRALKNMRHEHRLLQDMKLKVHTQVDELPRKIESLQNEVRDYKKAYQEAKDGLFDYESRDILKEAQEKKDHQLVRKLFLDRPVTDLQQLAEIIAKKEPRAVVLFATTDQETIEFVASAGNVAEIDMRQVAESALPVIDGSGGGNKKKAQGGGKALVPGDTLLANLVLATGLDNE